MTKTSSKMYDSFPSRIDPSTIAKQQFETQIEEMRRQTFKPFHIMKCQSHLLPKELICMNPTCLSSNQLLCPDCSHCSHPLISINKLIPLFCQWLFQQSTQIQTQNKKLFDEWNIVRQNLTYCIEIFQELLSIISNHLEKKIYAPTKFLELSKIIYGMWSKDSLNQTSQMAIKTCYQLQKKYKLFETSNKENLTQKRKQSLFTWQNVTCESLENQKMHRLSSALKANKKSKDFSQYALAFSQSLAELIENKIKEQQHKIKIKDLKIKNELCLKDLIVKFNQSLSTVQQDSSKLSEILENVETFTMELSGKENSFALNSDDFLQNELSQISKLKNLKELKINNKNGKIQHKMWYCILNYLEMLKFLKDLKLILTQRDLSLLVNLFKQKQKAVRQIESLTLQITDEKNLDLNKLNDFLNTLQLRRLNLNLSRNGLDFKKVQEFIKKLKIYTSLSQLPMIQCKIILTANNIHPDEKIQLQNLFRQVCKYVKINQLSL